MPADDFNPGGRDSELARKQRAQLGVCLAALRRSGNADLQRAVRQLAHDFGFRTLRGYLYEERRRRLFSDSLLKQLFHALASPPPSPLAMLAGPPPTWIPHDGRRRKRRPFNAAARNR